MYISYSNLWKLLIDKGITKKELMKLSGISSRTLSKLTKNKTVTTETLLNICNALNCDIAEIVRVCREEEKLSPYQAFKRYAQKIQKDELFTVYSLNINEKEYIIKKTNKKANKRTIIHCDGENIFWEQFYPLYSSPAREKTLISKKSFGERCATNIFLIDGAPLQIRGLDENGFVSYKQTSKSADDVYVLTMAEFKALKPKD